MTKNINADAVRQLAQLLEETGLGEIEYASGPLRIRVARQRTVVSEAAAIAPAAAPAAALATPAPSEKAFDVSHPGAIKSPMVGTGYLAPEPGAPSFVAVGDRVKAGQTLMLVEAMKTFNEIKSPRAGVVRQIAIENQQPVEYGDLLMIIE
ncbi:MAG: acetyl-CoA carboxylase biotin carboxyl carrier protein [Rhodospirillaceae bacterium]|nr:acetyl-CoA carboxylase biotin carboxyl carrier protein [Rhodospirillaceae bacterium]